MKWMCPREFRATESEMYEQRLRCCIGILLRREDQWKISDPP